MNKRYATALLVLLTVLDLTHTFWQNYRLPLDGDLAAIALPASWYAPVLHDPFGWAVLTKNEVYAGTNRFFAHATLAVYWQQAPRLLQHFMQPIRSLYVASALFTTATQALILVALAAYVRLGPAGTTGRGGGFWVAVALLAPLFQTEGYYEQMGVTNHAVTYTFFYALPMALLLGLLYPFYRAARWQQALHLRGWQVGLLVLLMVVIAFNGPIATAAVAVVLLGIGGQWLWQQWHYRRGVGPRAAGWLSGQAMALLAVLGALCLYSLYIGRNNSENTHDHTLAQLYQLLPEGIYQQLTLKLGLPLLIGLLVANAQLIRHWVAPSAERQWVLEMLRWVAWFAGIYVLLLPFGGYRAYRPHLLRNDSILPILLGLLYAYGQSAYFLLAQLGGRRRQGYLAGAVVVAVLFTYADRKHSNDNACERQALTQLAQSPAPVVHLATDCNVLTWGPVADYQQSEVPAAMLHLWGVTASQQLYDQPPH